MNNSIDQAQVIKQKQTDIIRESVSKAEKDGKLTKAQTGLIFEQHWFKMLAPSVYGGLQLAVPEALQLFEGIATADGSTGWTVTRCALAGIAGGFINPELAKEIFHSDKACIAGNIDATGIAEKTKTGYTLSGKWRHISGAADATAFITNCVITHNGVPQKDEANNTQTLSFVLLKNEVTITSTWNGMGLEATSSNDIEVKNLKVSADRSFSATEGATKVNTRLYHYPLVQLTEAALALNVAGMAFHFIALCENVFREHQHNNAALMDDAMVADTFEKHVQKVNDARTKLYYAADLTWQACLNNQPIKETILYKVSSSALDLVKKTRECVDALYPFCGLHATDKASEINRVWRDLHTACNERLLVFGGYN